VRPLDRDKDGRKMKAVEKMGEQITPLTCPSPAAPLVGI
jgi:hypothetical protein